MARVLKSPTTEVQFKRLIQGIMQDQMRLYWLDKGQDIPHHSTTVMPVAGGEVTIRGKTSFTDGPWIIYDGQYGRWQAFFKGPIVRTPHRVIR